MDGTNFSLGFTDQHFEPGVHICQIYSSEGERFETLSRYVASGFAGGERSACFSEKTDLEQIAAYMEGLGFTREEVFAHQAIQRSPINSVYFKEDQFDPDRMLALLEQFYRDALAEGFSSARVIGEMSAQVQHVHGGERLLEYESRVSLLQRKVPVTTVCQYDARAFDGATIMEILQVHPFMLVRGEVVHNPFYVSPEEFLAGR